MLRLAHHAVYNISITGVIVLSNEMIINIVLLHVWHTISSLKFVFKRGQDRLPYTPQPLYNTVRYNTALDITRINVGPQMVIIDIFSYITIHFTLVITRFG